MRKVVLLIMDEHYQLNATPSMRDTPVKRFRFKQEHVEVLKKLQKTNPRAKRSAIVNLFIAEMEQVVPDVQPSRIAVSENGH